MNMINISGSIYYLDDVVSAIENADDDVTLVINSPGGSALSALNVVNAINKCKHKVNAKIEVMACSAAAMIALACDHIQMEAHGILMIHNSWTIAVGNSHELESEAAALRAVDNAMHVAIEKHCSDTSVIEQMEAGDVWMTGDEAKEYFDNIEIVEQQRPDGMAAAVDVGEMIISAAKALMKQGPKAEPKPKEPAPAPAAPEEPEEPQAAKEPEPKEEPKPTYDAVTMALI
nr:MAG TPA: Putative ATP dependent Clp protease [Caudoviricetes sp.]